MDIHRNRRGPQGQVPAPGTFTLTRTGSTAGALTVEYTVEGSAVAPRTTRRCRDVTIPAGARTAAIAVSPASGAGMTGDLTVRVTLGPGAGFTVGGPAMAVAVIRQGGMVPGVFLDVPEGHWAGDWVEGLYTDDVTMGCGMEPPVYCPEASVTRAQMAIFLLRAKHGEEYVAPAGQGMLGDVPESHWAAGWIDELVAEGMAAGCGGGNYFPEAPVTRAQMAVFLFRANRGGSSVPAAQGLFGDVPADHWAAGSMRSWWRGGSRRDAVGATTVRTHR